MKRKTIIQLLLLLPMLISFCFAQSKIQGKISDSKDQQKLQNATIMLLSTKDSVLLDFTRSDENGNFSLNKPVTNEGLLIVSYPKYGDYYTSILPGQDYSALKVGLTNSAQLLQEVIVNGRIPITIKGDTTEFDAGSFKVEKNAKVEDLLKVLPGITVDASGKITAQGKTVKKVLLDGEEFFGDDPTLVTRNIRSDMVDKVQVYEKKSEQAERTGVDDGQREQTINVKLKDGAKRGMFGKALIGGGTDDYYMGQIMVNKFKGSQKISAYGLFGNNGTTSMNWQDADKYGGDSGVSYGDDGSMSMMNYTDPFSGQGVIGIPKAINSGINFSDKFDKNKHNVNISYKYGRLSSDGQDETIMSGLINNRTVKNIDTENDQHRVNLKYDLNFDSLNTLTIRGGASKKNLWSDNKRLAHQFSTDLDTITSENTKEIIDNDVKTYNLSALFTHKFKKKGRSITLNAQAKKDEMTGIGSLYSAVHKYNLDTDSITDQRKNRVQNTSNKQASLTYTEPLSKVLNLSIGGGIERDESSSLVESFNKSTTGNYDQLDTRYSNDYDFDRTSSNYKLALSYTTEKLRFNLTNSFNNDGLNQQNNYTNKEFSRDFFTYNPSLSAGYSFTKSKHLWFNYNGRNQLPSLTQIQPILDNSDQLNRYLGNENLKPSFSNNVNLGYNTFKLLTGSYAYIGGNLNLVKDPISQNISTSNGINTYEWNNITGKTNVSANFWSGYYFKLDKKLGVSNSPQLSMSLSENYNFFNNELNKVNTTNYNFTYNLTRDTKTGLNFNINMSPQYRVMESSLQENTNSNGFVFSSSGSVEYFFTKTFKVYSNYEYTYEAATKAFDQKFEQFLLHPGISKKFLKNESLMLDFTINDVLNQNKGFSRSASNSVFTQRRYDTIRRYYMLKLSWDFTKMFL
ncbi:outer membrane beta-barrel protein [Sphingobacterium sp. SRCM116780]|uniref:outer membrane beta-barrel protein n=1 Tax=Sphingobacterium sp. SRCM116780 TaxID=2907623 RepID=UPI001F48D9B1|nr:outer membrane beta-barrel protein [Sphingobacterium sp. SRCM116780]UIR55169.1 outer membrane beta-barrel protein [Sphingobacterium sp. SRCM116780]